MIVHTRYEQDLQTANPVKRLYQHVKDDVLHGDVSRDDAIAELEQLYSQLQADGREAEQDAVADVLDTLTGFAGPGLAI